MLIEHIQVCHPEIGDKVYSRKFPDVIVTITEVEGFAITTDCEGQFKNLADGEYYWDWDREMWKAVYA